MPCGLGHAPQSKKARTGKTGRALDESVCSPRIGRTYGGGVMDLIKGFATFVVLGFIGPLMWLVIGMINNKIGESLNRRAAVWDPKQSRAKQRLFYYLSRFWTFCQKPLF